MKNIFLHFGLALLLSMACVSAKGGTVESTSVADNDIYEIILVANPTEGGIVLGSGTYRYEEIVLAVAIPNDCYDFVMWTENGVAVSSDPAYMFSATQSRVLVANFAPKTCEIFLFSNPSSGGAVFGGGTYSCGDMITVMALANPCAIFVNWTENGIVVSVDAMYSFTATETRLLIANFEIIGKGYNIVLSADPVEGGEVSGGGACCSGSMKTVIATANEGYKFIHWTENDKMVSDTPDYTFTVEESRTLTAHFAPIADTYEIILLANPMDCGDVFGAGTYSYGDEITVTAVSPCCIFVCWMGDDGVVVSTNPYSFTVTEDRTLTAHFVPKLELITLTKSMECGEIFGGGAYSCGTEITISAVPSMCCKFLEWTENGVLVSTDPDYSFTVTEDRTLTAHFALEEYEIIILSDPPEGGELLGGFTCPCGTYIMISAPPTDGCKFINWTEGDVVVSTDINYAFTVFGSRTLTAHFDCNVNIETIGIDGIHIYPNPTSGELRIIAGANNYLPEQIMSVDIFDVMGRKVSSFEFRVSGSELGGHPFLRGGLGGLDISNLPNGVYFIRIQTEMGVVTRRVIKN